MLSVEISVELMAVNHLNLTLDFRKKNITELMLIGWFSCLSPTKI